MRARHREPEVMDDAALDEGLLHGALRGLHRINWLSRSAQIVWEPIRALAHHKQLKKLRVLDVATGGGDVPIALWQLSQRYGLVLDLLGIDINPKSLAFGQQQAARAGAQVRFSQLDLLRDELPAGYDVVMCSLFLHHLEQDAVIGVLEKMARATNHLLLASDLRRHPWGLLLAHLAGRVLSTSPVVRVDAVRSVRAAFTLPEIKVLSDAAGLKDANFAFRWPCRFLLSWQKNKESRSDD